MSDSEDRMKKGKLEEPKEAKPSSKLGKAFLIFSILNFVGLLIVLVLFPDFIGEDEKTLIDYLPWRAVFLLWVLFAIFLGIGQFAKPPFFEPVWLKNSRIMKVLIFILVVPSFSFLFAASSVLIVYGLINYSFIHEKKEIEGELYKKEISESRGHRGGRWTHHHCYFNKDKKYKIKVSESLFEELREGDNLELKVLKGRLTGYYVSDSIYYKRLTEPPQIEAN
tara:strand:- start:188 stop:856 length:669 start_codon:yes stop_codon:yes gene_type:complete